MKLKLCVVSMLLCLLLCSLSLLVYLNLPIAKAPPPPSMSSKVGQLLFLLSPSIGTVF